MKPIVRRQARIAIAYALAGVACRVVLALRYGRFPLGYWILFSIAFFALEFRAVEVNDRMLQSSGSMVLLTAGTLFALQPDTNAAFAIAAMAAVGPLVPNDLKERRWFQPISNFGQLVVSATVAGLILDGLLVDMAAPTARGFVNVAIAGAAASVAYTAVNVTMVRSAVRYVYGQRMLLPWSGLHLLLPAQVLLGLMGGLLGAAFFTADKQAVIVLILAVYLIAHLSFSSYAQLREAHQAALRGFVKALEARDLYTRGHTERVAYFAQLIGEELHFTGTQLEKLRWACLIHDLGKLAIPGELLSKPQLTPEEFDQMRQAARKVEGILAEVDFLRPMVSISGVHYLDLERFDAANWSLEASIVATADAFDALTSTRRYRMAMSQQEAFEELRADTSGRFYPDVIDALERALERTGEVYGATSYRRSETAEAQEGVRLA